MTAYAQPTRTRSKTGYVFGWLSFIPGLGVIFGVVAIVIGAARGENKVAMLGVGGIAFTFVVGTALFYFRLVPTYGPFEAMQAGMAEQMMRIDAGQIALYKHQHGRLPKTFAEIPKGQRVPFAPVDYWGRPTDTWGKPLDYTVNDDGTFELRSAGPDGQFGTADDIVLKF
jgi:hypothetical protein